MSFDPSSASPGISISPAGRFDLPVSHGYLEALLKEPAAPERAAVVCHPHPKGGGTMNNNVVYRMARALEARRAAVLRFNFRGVGRSTGTYGDGQGEVGDARAALDFMAARFPKLPLWMAGFSFGSRVGIEAALGDARVSKLLGVGMAVRMFDLSFLEGTRGGRPLAIVQADQDEYGDRAEIEAFTARLDQPKRLWIVDGATHLFPGKLDELEAAVTDALAWLEGQGDQTR